MTYIDRRTKLPFLTVFSRLAALSNPAEQLASHAYLFSSAWIGHTHQGLCDDGLCDEEPREQVSDPGLQAPTTRLLYVWSHVQLAAQYVNHHQPHKMQAIRRALRNVIAAYFEAINAQSTLAAHADLRTRLGNTLVALVKASEQSLSNGQDPIATTRAALSWRGRLGWVEKMALDLLKEAPRDPNLSRLDTTTTQPIRNIFLNTDAVFAALNDGALHLPSLAESYFVADRTYWTDPICDACSLVKTNPILYRAALRLMLEAEKEHRLIVAKPDNYDLINFWLNLWGYPSVAREMFSFIHIRGGYEHFRRLKTGLRPWCMNWPTNWVKVCTAVESEVEVHENAEAEARNLSMSA
jgi:hypothetical protein